MRRKYPCLYVSSSKKPTADIPPFNQGSLQRRIRQRKKTRSNKNITYSGDTARKREKATEKKTPSRETRPSNSSVMLAMPFFLPGSCPLMLLFCKSPNPPYVVAKEAIYLEEALSNAFTAFCAAAVALRHAKSSSPVCW